jgi:hypothetical protein
MLQLAVALMIPIYMLTRLAQIPIEHSSMHGKARVLGVISAAGAALIIFLTLDLMLS